jgi:hypothetical protein
MLPEFIKSLLIGAMLLCVVTWVASAETSEIVSIKKQEPKPLIAASGDAGYVDSDACKDCHEDQFKALAHTSHAELAT